MERKVWGLWCDCLKTINSQTLIFIISIKMIITIILLTKNKKMYRMKENNIFQRG